MAKCETYIDRQTASSASFTESNSFPYSSYNVEPYLRKCVDSIVVQIYTDPIVPTAYEISPELAEGLIERVGSAKGGFWRVLRKTG